MKMIPNIPYFTNSQAEKRIFEQLRLLFNEPDYYAFHSLNLTLHNYKRAGEIDFLILCPLGVYVLEIKGGRVTCQNGEWFFTNRWGEHNSKPESPFKQAETALYGIIEKLRTQFSSDFMRNIAIGYGVILPDCQLNVSSAEWDRAQLCDNGQYRHLETWLKHLFSYYRQRNQQNKRLNSMQVKEIATYLRPSFESVIPLSSQNAQTLDEIHFLTEEQMYIIRAIENNQRILCEGGAGTGKTFLAIELAKIWANQGLQVGIICHSIWLKNYLQHHNKIKNVIFSTALGLKQNLNRAGLTHFDALIIDEAQDLLRFEYLDKLHSSINQGLEQGKWACFLDINNQSGFFNQFEPKAYEYLKSLVSTNLALKNNCRNTEIILHKIKKEINADMGVRGAGTGIDIIEVKDVQLFLLENVLQNQISQFQREGINDSQITILADEQLAWEIKTYLPHYVQGIDDFSIQSFPIPYISFATAGNFKGLENDVIIFIHKGKNLLNNKNLSYVAMSRAKSILVIIYLAE